MDKNKKGISDLGAAAYVLMHGYKVIGRKGKEIFFSLDNKSEENFERIVLDYLSSEFHRFDSCIMSLKKINECSTDLKNFKSVSDLGAAAYILMHKYKVIGKKNKYIYFEVDKESKVKFDELSLEYISSDFHRFDSCLMSLKKIGEYISNE